MPSLDPLFLEAETRGLTVRIDERYWSHDPRFLVWLRSKADPTLASKGEGNTLVEALTYALNSAFSFDPEPVIKAYYADHTAIGLPSLDSLMPNPKSAVEIIPGAVRRL